MNRRLSLAAVAATTGAGLLSAAFLQAAVAAADSGSDAGFTIGGLSFNDPTVIPGFGGGSTPIPGYESITPLFSNAPLLSIGTDKPLGFVTVDSQQFTLADSSGTTLGTVVTQVNDQNLLGIETAQFTVASTTPATGLTSSQTAELPANGTVYSITNLGSGYANVYEAAPNSAGTSASSITDTLVTPYGDINVPTSYDAIAPLAPGAPFEALGAASGNAGASSNAFTIGGTTFDPGSDGFNTLNANLFSVAPLLKFQASSIGLGNARPEGNQTLEVYSGGADAGAVHSSVSSADILGIDNSAFTVQEITPTESAIQSALSSDLNLSNASFTAHDLATVLAGPSGSGSYLDFGSPITGSEVDLQLINQGIDLNGSGITASDIATALNGVSTAGLPTDGTVYSVTNLGSGFENVYEAIPNSGGTAASSITDTLVTPYGDINVPTTFDAVAPLNPGTPLEALAATSSNPDVSANAFTLGGTIFDPGSGGFDTVAPLFSIAPVLEIAGGQAALGSVTLPLAEQDGVTMYDSSGTDLGSVNLGESLSNILGIETTQLTVSQVNAATGLTAAQTAELPAKGTVYSVTDLGSGMENVYEAIPNSAGTAASHITDTLVTPYGNIDLSSMFDAIAALDPGNAAAGVDAATSAASTAFDLFNPASWF